jgi:glycosyltransferase involved in cell wall biosynthesis
MAAGLPVVISDLPAKRRLINSIGNGILVDPLDYYKTATAIRELINNESLMMEMSVKGYSAFIDKYNWEHVAEDMILSLDSLDTK